LGAKNLENLNTTIKPKTLSVYGYTNYRQYLKDYYDFKKDSCKGFSYRSFSKSAGFSSPNYLKLVSEGTRNISLDACEKFVKALALEGQMADYFATLVQMNQSKLDREKELFLTKLKNLTPQSKKRELNLENLKYLSNWLHPVLREIVELEDFDESPYWISRRLTSNASLNEISSALSFLKKENFLVSNQDGKLVAQDNMVISSDEVKNIAIRNYHRQMLSQATESLDTVAMEDREFGALTIVLPESATDELKYKLKKFRQELHQWATQVSEESKSNQVIQLNFQMFPQTKKAKK